uniref:Uncharacterized protein n=1 Tax=Alexandrium monilatum TaxID=311494 RepID=A0A7S4W7Z1_9DINO
MVRECDIVSPEDAARNAAGRVELTRELFQTHMRNVAFSSWEELLATLAGKPTSRGYQGLHGEGSSVFRLDPVRVFGWTAVLLVNVGIWGLVGYFSKQSTLLGLVLTVAYGAALWRITHRGLAPQLAGVLWPCVPVAAAAVGILAQVLLVRDLGALPDDGQLQAALALLLSALPETAVAVYLLRGVREDPDRATLAINVFAGMFAVIQLLYAMLWGETSYWFAGTALLLLGLVFVLVALQLFVKPGMWGSVELVSWMLNLGCLALYVSAHVLLGVPVRGEAWRLLLFALVALGIGLLGSVCGRSFPFLLTAIGLLVLSGEAAFTVAAAVPSEMYDVARCAVFGLLGVVIIGVGQWLQQSRWWAEVTVGIRCAMARAFGSEDLPYTWSQTLQAPLEPAEP